MSVESRRFGDDQPPVADCLMIREVLLNRLGGLFTLVPSKGDWGGGVEPVRIEDHPFAEPDRTLLAVGGVATFGSEWAARKHVGILSEPTEEGESHFFVCEWSADLDVEEWAAKNSGDPPPVQWVHVLPERGGDVFQTPNLDLYTLSLLNLTRFTQERTKDLKTLLCPPSSPLPSPNLYERPYF